MFPQKQQFTIFIFLIIASILVFLSKTDYGNNLIFYTNKIQQMRESRISQQHGHLIKTPGCTLPKTRFFPNEFHLIKDYAPICDFEKRIATINHDTEMLELTEDGMNNMDPNSAACGAYEIHRYSPMLTFKNDPSMFNVTGTTPLDVSDKEFVVTKCGKFVNYDAHFPLNKIVRQKIDFWKKVKTEKPIPISVLFIGIDSTSRSHFHRSLPKTLPLLTKMGFIDFRGYHSMTPHTINNFFAFLMGLTKSDSTVQPCGPIFKKGYDDCPIIWKLFNLHNFVTMYTEDGAQTFQYKKEGGFTKKPTDYYTQPLFASLKTLSMTEHANSRNDDQCPSTLNSPNFLLDYTERFLKKFANKSKTPFFSFTWFGYPFHDNTHTLFGLDDKLAEFFAFLNSEESQGLLERTLIILNSDHGERFGDFIKNGYYEGFIERLLPGLFIRLPENLLKQFPELNLTETMRINSERLTSGFDIHHTLLHLLKLQGLDTQVKFNPVLPDRSSLFLPVSEHRTCTDINVPPENCMCIKTSTVKTGPSSTTTSDTDFQNKNPRYFHNLVKFAIFELNSVLKTSEYFNVCEIHGELPGSFISWNAIFEMDGNTGGVLRFVTDLNKAQFDVQLRIEHETKDITVVKSIARMGSFNRLNRYGNSSWCVNIGKDDDKIFEELCHCRGRENTV